MKNIFWFMISIVMLVGCASDELRPHSPLSNQELRLEAMQLSEEIMEEFKNQISLINRKLICAVIGGAAAGYGFGRFLDWLGEFKEAEMTKVLTLVIPCVCWSAIRIYDAFIFNEKIRKFRELITQNKLI